MDQIRLRKTRLQDDLELLEGSFENRVTKIKSNLLGSINPVQFIKGKPFRAVGIAVVTGIAFGLLSRKKRSGGNASQDSTSSLSDDDAYRGPGFTTILLDEVKRIAARRAAGYISDFVDQKLSDRER